MIQLPKPFGFVGQSMLLQKSNPCLNCTFIGSDKRFDKTDEPVYTLSQIRWLLSSNGVKFQEGGGNYGH